MMGASSVERLAAKKQKMRVVELTIEKKTLKNGKVERSYSMIFKTKLIQLICQITYCQL